MPMKKCHYTCFGTCSRSIDFEVRDGCVFNISFEGGCNGNLKAISKLVEGMKIEDVVSKLKGNTCGFRSTSCADQLARALEQASQENK